MCRFMGTSFRNNEEISQEVVSVFVYLLLKRMMKLMKKLEGDSKAKIRAAIQPTFYPLFFEGECVAIAANYSGANDLYNMYNKSSWMARNIFMSTVHYEEFVVGEILSQKVGDLMTANESFFVSAVNDNILLDFGKNGNKILLM